MEVLLYIEIRKWYFEISFSEPLKVYNNDLM